MEWQPRPPKHPAPPLPDGLLESCDARYIYSCQQCGLSLSDLMLMSYRQMADLLELNAFYADAAEHWEDDEQARRGEAAFWA